ncbi:MAG: hypothetical protein US42_C0004G0008 [Candidatus Magasanikbacteria bacterium GW2011_GWC2_37_14]|uniref:Transglycosylase SLT domain-containing protein n=1 Tax=Candidatus Magasanikbacteria bacterium GW2011_GWC2_37_14 TaxID=1619046 RepID=A0A0G0IUN1_9BACT|nr:MAG: hypothetical protein US42_C0004G0008 [Candidatus Magasanikbacteria bacterium GW2011_GWC2_37_14]
MKKSLSIIILIFCLFPSLTFAVGTKAFGQPCNNNSECKSDDCENSNKEENGKTLAFCDCGEVYGEWVPFNPGTSKTCSDEFGGVPEDWKCHDGEDMTWDLDYCIDKRNATNSKFPLPIKDQSFWDYLVNSDATPATIKLLDEVKTIKPTPRVSIPGVNFSEIKTVEENGSTYMYIPFLGEYIAAIYKYAIAVMAVISIVMIIGAGLGWVMSAGEAEKISHSKKRIGEAIIGILLAVGSYSLLYRINPNLVEFKNLRVAYVTGADLSKLILEGHSVGYWKAQPISSTQYDSVFQSFANCIGIDWRVLKGISHRESGLNADIVNKIGYTGLFQTLPEYCKENLKQMKLNESLCDTLTIKNPAVNTAIGVNMIKYHLKLIESKCKNAPDEIKILMIYFGNANGSGGLEQALDIFKCDPNTWPDTTFPAGTKYGLGGKKVFRGAPRDYTFGTAATVMGLGVTNLYVTVDKNQCPSNTKILPE